MGSYVDPNATVVDGAGDFDSGRGFGAFSGEPRQPADWVGEFWHDWSIVGKLGSGSYGSVFSIAKTSMGYTAKAAAKIILIPHEHASQTGANATSQDSWQLARRMHDEIRVMSELSGQRNIVIIQDSNIRKRDDADGYALGIRMELLESLPTRVQRLGSPFPVKEAVRVALDVCRALVICHDRKIMHRDVKPENVFWSESLGEYKLGDFGIAKQLEASAQTWGVQTSIGTPQYEAPEIYLRQKYSYNVDVYSLGVMLFRLLNDDRAPFLPSNAKECTGDEMWAAEGRRIGGERFPDPMRGDKYLADVIRSATAGNPAHRFRSARAFYNALEAWQG